MYAPILAASKMEIQSWACVGHGMNVLNCHVYLGGDDLGDDDVMDTTFAQHQDAGFAANILFIRLHVLA